MPTPQHSIINVVADQPTTRHHHDFACETNHVRTLAQRESHVAKYISPTKPGHSPTKPSAIPGGSPAQIPGGSPGAIPVGLAQGLSPGPALGLPLGRAQGISEDIQTSERLS